jgi:NADPH:quinone reductase-like Zn-dependent oxidoreductase
VATLEERATHAEVAGPTMKAAVRERFGPPRDVVELRALAKPEPAPDEVLVRVRAASVNIADWYGVVGRPYVGRVAMGLRRAKDIRLGVDYAGVVEAVGSEVKGLRPGDEVFGGRSGAYAEYVVAKADRAITRKPANVSFEEAAAVPVAGTTALQALRDKGQLHSGQNVLVHGASGGVGTMTIQIAKALGATVTAVCSPPNVEIARSLGADLIVDYTVEDCTRSDKRYDLVVDIAGTRSFGALRRVLARDATVVVVGGPRANRLVGPLGHVLASTVASRFTRQHAVFFVAKLNHADTETLRELLEARRLTPTIDTVHPLDDLALALDRMGGGHPRGKVVVSI